MAKRRTAAAANDAQALSDQEVAAIWNDLEGRIRRGDPLARRDQAVFSLVTLAGLRASEVAKVRVDEVDRLGGSQCVVRVNGRRAPVQGPGRLILCQFSAKLATEAHGAGRLPLIRRELADGRVQALTRWTVRDCWRRATRYIDRIVTTDDGRAAYARLMLRSEPFEAVARAMGFTHPQTLRRYIAQYRNSAE